MSAPKTALIAQVDSGTPCERESMIHGEKRYVLTFSCGDRVGIVAAVSRHLAERGGFIVDSQQYADLELGRFFMRVEFKGTQDQFPDDLVDLKGGFTPIASEFAMDWQLTATENRVRLLIAVSKASHCLNDLLHRWHTGDLPVEIAAVVSNHPDLRELADWYKIPFYHLPVSPDSKPSQEGRLLALFREKQADFLVLARYMQVLSPELVDSLAGRCINIHHSFLPSFKGSRPYRRAHDRGVKLIGATAHFVTSELDEGPIIEQDVERVDHRAAEADLVRIGRDIEARVLARAIHWIAERRVLLNDLRTVVFR
jgi:formyltetrahydrofolate deformylase